MLGSIFLSLVVGSASLTDASQQVNAAPIVDLGYSLHKGQLNDAGDIYSFNNIRFAEPPIGKYRFKPSVPVATVNRTLNDGSFGHVCPQVLPTWSGSIDDSMEPSESEDCLFLDVVVPKKIFEKREAHQSPCSMSKGAPVMVWIYGGGFVAGSKDAPVYAADGIISRSREAGSDGIVYVALNYRLGLFGWLNGQGDDAIFPNVALQDQRLGLEWVKHNIHHFGGDPNMITVFGESAGGGSIMHHITAEGGKKKAPFNRALIQSPGFLPVADPNIVFQRTLSYASRIAGKPVQCGIDLAQLDSATLIKINQQVIADSVHDTYTYGPTVDGGYVPDYPGVLLLEGKFDSEPDVMLGHNAHEGLLYVEPYVNTTALVNSRISQAFSDFPQATMNYILSELYPPANESNLYATEVDRGVLLFSELVFTCNTRYLATAFGNQTWNYIFTVAPATHGQDVPFTFYNGVDKDVDAPELAKNMQRYFTKFAEFGDPNAGLSLPKFPVYGSDADVLILGADKIETHVDDTKNTRCDYWQKAAYRVA